MTKVPVAPESSIAERLKVTDLGGATTGLQYKFAFNILSVDPTGHNQKKPKVRPPIMLVNVAVSWWPSFLSLQVVLV